MSASLYSVLIAVLLMTLLTNGCSDSASDSGKQTDAGRTKVEAKEGADPKQSGDRVRKSLSLAIDNEGGLQVNGEAIRVQDIRQQISGWTACDLIVGAKGDGLQLFLSTVLRSVPPVRNVPYLFYKELKQNQRVATAIPLALGDTTKKAGFSVVATTGQYFTMPYALGNAPGDKPRRFDIRWKDGQKSFAGKFDAVIGSEVAKKNGWDIGSTVRLVHGSAAAGVEPHIHDEEFTVRGVLKKTGTPNDKTVFVNLDGFYAIPGHAKSKSEMRFLLEDFFSRKYTDAEWAALRKNPDSLREVTAILIYAARPPDDPLGKDTSAAFDLQSRINFGYKAQAISPQVAANLLVDRARGYARLLHSLQTGKSPE